MLRRVSLAANGVVFRLGFLLNGNVFYEYIGAEAHAAHVSGGKHNTNAVNNNAVVTYDMKARSKSKPRANDGTCDFEYHAMKRWQTLEMHQDSPPGHDTT